ncbi:MAG: lysozyme [Alphaproteobacteria bacterium]|nr:lysozyme [Alphaproteobacteria bacterium]
MQLSAAGLAFIQRFEGFSPTVYRDAAGLPTIGYGHLLVRGEERGFVQPLSEEKAARLLAADVVVAERAVRRSIAVALTQSQFDALVSFTFNLGSGVLERSTLRRVINRGEEAAIAGEWMRWVWAGGRKLPGLARRRAAELALYQA